MTKIILASQSSIRKQLMMNAGIAFTVSPANLDEKAMIDSLKSEGANMDTLVDVLAEAKSRKVSLKNPNSVIIGADQIISLEGEILGKPKTPVEARMQLLLLSGKAHLSITASVIYENSVPIWRLIKRARIHFRELSEGEVDAYIAAHLSQVLSSAGGYQIEAAGLRLISHFEGDYFSVLGLPIIEIAKFLRGRGNV